jgi:hypothetical protein
LPVETSSEIEAAIAEFEIGWLGKENNARLRDSLQARADKAQLTLQNDPGEISDAFLDIAPGLMFLLLPLFALLLKIVYLTSGRYYAEHLVLAIHNHSALFAVVLFSALLEWLEESFSVFLGSSIILAWIPLYMFISLKRVFDESFAVTALKFSVLGSSYLVFFLFAFVFGWIAGIMTL